MPTIKKNGYPTDVLKQKVITGKLDWDAHRFNGGKFAVTVITPVLLGKARVRDDLMRAGNRYKRAGA